MYTEDYERRGFPLRDFLQKLILVIVFALILVWLLPKFISPRITATSNQKSGSACTNTTCDTSGIDALTSQIFANNLEKMKQAAISYYTDERLPKNVGDSDTMTLSDMIGKKLIVPLIDKKGNACNVEESYVRITKVEKEYTLKVQLKDSEKSDYILVHLGCYTYCEGDVCQKQGTTVPTKGSKTTNYVPIKGYVDHGTYVAPTKTTPVVPTPQPTPTPVPTPTPTPEDKHVCVKYNGKYYNKAGNTVDKVNYIIDCQNPKCANIDNLYFDDKGNNVNKEDYEKKCKSKHYVYEYQKTTSTKFSAWTKWSSWEKADCATKEINCNDESTTCLNKLQMLKRKEQIGTYEKTYAKQRDMIVQTGSYTSKTCANYNYVEINKTIYATTKTTKYTLVNTITASTRHSIASWVYTGRVSYTTVPKDTATTIYKYVGADYSKCAATCDTTPSYYYDVYTYAGRVEQVSNTLTAAKSISASTTTSTDVTSETIGYEASCGQVVETNIPIYSTITVTEKAKRTEPLYGDVCYKSTKTRNLINEGKTTKKWSKFNDRTLLDNGWSYTGKVKEDK